MVTLTETSREWEFIVSEANGDYQREQVVLIAGQNLKSGSVLGKITASGKYTILSPAAADGSQTAVAILGRHTDASLADKRTAIYAGGNGEVNANLLTYPGGITAPQRATAIANLLAVGIKVR